MFASFSFLEFHERFLLHIKRARLLEKSKAETHIYLTQVPLKAIERKKSISFNIYDVAIEKFLDVRFLSQNWNLLKSDRRNRKIQFFSLIKKKSKKLKKKSKLCINFERVF